MPLEGRELPRGLIFMTICIGGLLLAQPMLAGGEEKRAVRKGVLMRRYLIFGLLGLIGSLAGPAWAGEALPFDVKNLPLDDASLQTLDDRHLRLTRKASTVCRHTTSPDGGSFMSGSSPIPLGTCVISTLDHLVREKNDAALSAYHYVMTPSRRYNENREMGYWRTVKKQREAGSAIPGVGGKPD